MVGAIRFCICSSSRRQWSEIVQEPLGVTEIQPRADLYPRASQIKHFVPWHYLTSHLLTSPYRSRKLTIGVCMSLCVLCPHTHISQPYVPHFLSSPIPWLAHKSAHAISRGWGFAISHTFCSHPVPYMEKKMSPLHSKDDWAELHSPMLRPCPLQSADRDEHILQLYTHRASCWHRCAAVEMLPLRTAVLQFIFIGRSVASSTWERGFSYS